MTLATGVDRTHEERFIEMQGRLAVAIGENELLKESLNDALAMIAADNEGWRLLGGGGNDDQGPSLDAIREVSEKARAFVGMNPLVKHGVQIRAGYVWGEGVGFNGASQRSSELVTKILSNNAKYVFSPPAYDQLEMALATDGNLFLLSERKSKRIVRVPLSEIAGFVTSDWSNEQITYFKRIWTTSTVDEQNQLHSTEHKAWFPAADFKGPYPASINGVPVEKDFSMTHVAANRQEGWLWGLPDVFAVMLWARAYKAFLEANWTLTLSLSRWAFKLTMPTGAAAARAAAKVAAPVLDGSNPAAGPAPTVGDTASIGGGGDLTAVNKAGASLDYDAGKPLAGMVAAGLSISLDSLLSETQSGEETLTRATVKIMSARQSVWDTAFTELFESLGVKDPDIVFPPVRADPIHRDVQAIVTAANTGTLFPKEVRAMLMVALRGFGVVPMSGMPKKGQWKEFTQGLNTDNPGTSPLNVPNPSDGPNPGAQSDGDNQMRKDDTATDDDA